MHGKSLLPTGYLQPCSPKNFKRLFTNSLIKRIIFVLSLILLYQLETKAQNYEDLSNIRVEELTDEQVRRFLLESDRLSLKVDQIEEYALQKGMNPVEIVKLKNRLQSVRKSLLSTNYRAFSGSPKPVAVNRLSDSASSLEQAPLDEFNTVFSELRGKNFGAEVFNNKSLTFEPKLQIPTPNNYLLAADDELLIDVSGFSEASYRLRVTPEGIIRIPVAGPIPVNGLTIEQARKSITNKLARTIYRNITTGQTSVDVTLAAIRSIKVTVIGEATRPGTYTLPSLASAYNALYTCGGPNSYGSFRNIQVIRNNKVLSTIDVYEYLLNGSKKNDIRLMDEDVIKINTYDIRIELKGEVKKPGLYDVSAGETLAKIIQYAGGFTDNAYTAMFQVFRNTSKERQLTTIKEAQLGTIIPQKGDSYIIGKILNRITNRISIKGAIYRPGEYEIRPGMTLSQLIREADGLREDAFTSRASLHRLKDDLSPEIVSFDLEKILKGEGEDIILKREDRVTIYSKFDLKEGYYVSIEGEVSTPGIFLFEEGLNVQDLVLMAGGLKESASLSRVEISRRVKGANQDSANLKTALIYQQNITLDLKDSGAMSKITLLPFDEVSIRPAPGYFVQKNAVIEGEVIYSGKYTLEAKNDRISDLVKRSGGLTSGAYPKGAVLVRTRNFTKTEQSNNEQGLIELLKQNFAAGASTAVLENQLAIITRKRSENVGIDLEKILENPQSEYDLLLNDGDTLRIPKQLQTVRVSGDVLYPSLVRFSDTYKFKDYISGAGGFSERSSKKRPYVVYANGSVKGTQSFLFFKNYPKLSPGAEIFVPTRRERERLRTGEVITIGATVVTMLAILFNVIRK